ncbi:MAG: RNA-binding S4 domain-containing protein [Burkholderiaceae bacterium]|nr:RNA-binding S4 domain-containing protein [Burkholderiaceae bacterium]
MGESMRLDKWLWAARLYKTRTLAAHAAALGRVEVNGAPAKAARELRVGDRVSLQQAGYRRELVITRISSQRGGATMARTLYEETAESLAAHERLLQQRRLAPEPAASVEQGRPTKRDRRALASWERWSARADE